MGFGIACRAMHTFMQCTGVLTISSDGTVTVQQSLNVISGLSSKTSKTVDEVADTVKTIASNMQVMKLERESM